ncbi:hypothetical protein GCM10009801_75030 [Streptomyces albiaxialis]|uniref:Uncharacterized protein n=1 Tax=Streptomyces albiaxialis TaxID=329523 RepID=A0ABN2X129_9ACTN
MAARAVRVAAVTNVRMRIRILFALCETGEPGGWWCRDSDRSGVRMVVRGAGVGDGSGAGVGDGAGLYLWLERVISLWTDAVPVPAAVA